jgi:heme/copper-type cytochrome/quinol oxidase subunit 2
MRSFRRLCLVAIVLAAMSLAPAARAKQSVLIICHKSYYTPSTIHVKKGEPIELVLRSADVTHGFAIDALNVAVEVAPGPATVVQINPTVAGSYEFHCVVRCGKGHANMRGTLIVED